MEEMGEGWNQLQTLWETRKGMLEQSMNYQVRNIILLRMRSCVVVELIV